MYLLGHVGLAFLANHFAERRFGYRLSILEYIILTFSALIPDILDKPISLIFFGNGRWVGHSLLFLVLFSLFILFINFDRIIHRLEKNEIVARLNTGGNPARIGKLIIAGILLHLIGDGSTLNPIVIFWPLLGSFPLSDSDAGFLYGFSDPITRMGEIFGLITLVYINYANGWSKRGLIKILILVMLYLVTFLIAYILLV
jgi:hypothetical protein